MSVPLYKAEKIIKDELTDYLSKGSRKVVPDIEFKKSNDGIEILFELKRNKDLLDFLVKTLDYSEEMKMESSIMDSIVLKDEDVGYRIAKFPGDSIQIMIEKEGNLEESDIQRIIDLYKAANPMGLTNSIEELGITTYKHDNKFSWDYIAGYEDVKEEIRNTVIMPLKNPDVFDSIAKKTRKVFESNTPRSVLFEGPPGTGKTTMAKIIGNEIERPLIYVPIQSITSKWYGESEENMSKVFEYAEEINGIMFLDEMDVFGMSRDVSDEATRRILSVLLTEIDGFKSYENNSLLVGATNRKKDLDRALLSRFDNVIEFRLPTESEREEIFKNYAKHLSSKELQELSGISNGMSGRDIKEICESAEREFATKIINGEESGELPTQEIYKKYVSRRIRTHKI